MTKSKILLTIILFSTIIAVRADYNSGGIDFTLKDADGNTYSFNDVKDAKAVVIMFWSAECPNVQAYNRRIVKLIEKYSAGGIIFWAINSNSTETPEQIKSHAKEHSYNFPVLLDEGNIVADKFAAQKTPEVFVFNNEKSIVYHGRIDNNRDENKVTSYDLMNALDELLAGKEITVTETKSFGCTIKRKQSN